MLSTVRVRLAIILVALFVLVSAATLFFSTIGSAYPAQWLEALGDGAGPPWAERLYGLALRINPYAAGARLSLARLCREQGRSERAEALLLEGVERFCTDADLYLALSALYSDTGRLEEACALLAKAPSGTLARRIENSRPPLAEAPPSGAYNDAVIFMPALTGGACWYRLNESGWRTYTAPVRMGAGEHRLEVITLSEAGVPSQPGSYRYSVRPSAAAASGRVYAICPYCGAWFLSKTP